MRSNVMRVGLEALYYSGAYRALAPFMQGVGVIFTLHHVRPTKQSEFWPNRILDITPEFLRESIARVRDLGFDLVSLDEAHRRLTTGDTATRFAAFTLDDGYLDNLEYAYPIFKEFDCPFAIYVATSVIDGTCELWWQALEDVIAAQDSITVTLGPDRETFDLTTSAEKWSAYNSIYWRLRAIDEDRQRDFIRDLTWRYDIDMRDLCRTEAMTWPQLRELAKDPQVTIGAHTVNHYALAQLDRERAMQEMREGAERLGEELGEAPRHFSYPYGDTCSAGLREFEIARELGFKTAVTTRKGVVHPSHKNYLTALPRVSLNGDFQSRKYIDVFLSGVPFTLFNGFRKLNVA